MTSWPLSAGAGQGSGVAARGASRPAGHAGRGQAEDRMVPRARVAGIRAPVGLVQDGVQDAAEQRPIAEAILAAFGWPASQFACLDPFWEREPGWSVTAAPQWSPPTSGGSTRGTVTASCPRIASRNGAGQVGGQDPGLQLDGTPGRRRPRLGHDLHRAGHQIRCHLHRHPLPGLSIEDLTVDPRVNKPSLTVSSWYADATSRLRASAEANRTGHSARSRSRWRRRRWSRAW